MPRHPLLPLLRIGALVILGAFLLWPTTATRPRLVGGVWATDIDGMGDMPIRLGERVTGPLEGQKRPPCIPRREREVAGACWIPHAERPPCPEGVWEGEGICLVPVLASKRPATSIGR